MMSICNAQTGGVIFSGNYPSFAAMVQDAANLGVDLSNANLSGQNLQGVNLSGTLLQAAVFDNSNMQGANLDNADLTNASVVNAVAVNVNFSQATTDGLDLSGTVTTNPVDVTATQGQ